MAAIIVCSILLGVILITLWVFRGIEKEPEWVKVEPMKARQLLRECRKEGGTPLVVARGVDNKVHIRCKHETTDFQHRNVD